MEFSEVLRLGGYHWDSYALELDDEVEENDWVLVSRSPGPIAYRVLAVFDESFLELGQSAGDAVAAWGEEVKDYFDYMLVEDFRELLAVENTDPDDEIDEDDEAQYWEDERWRDDL